MEENIQIESESDEETHRVLAAHLEPLATLRRRVLARISVLSKYPSFKKEYPEYEKELQDECQQYAALSCKMLCGEIHTKLPREVRDLIYELLIGESFVSMEKLMNCRTFPPLEILNRQAWRERHRHCWDPGFLGTLVFQELVETWYRVTLFHITQPSLIESLLSRDPFMICPRPGNFISNIVFLIKEKEDFAKTSGRYKPLWSDLLKAEASPIPLPPFEALITNLQKLAMFRAGTKMTFHLYSSSFSPYAGPFTALWPDTVRAIHVFLQKLDPQICECFRNLKRAEYRLRIYLDKWFRLTEATDFSSELWFREIEEYQRAS